MSKHNKWMDSEDECNFYDNLARLVRDAEYNANMSMLWSVVSLLFAIVSIYYGSK